MTYTYPCDKPNAFGEYNCPFHAEHYETCRVCCGYGVDENETEE